jgi:hypothetical protein
MSSLFRAHFLVISILSFVASPLYAVPMGRINFPSGRSALDEPLMDAIATAKRAREVSKASEHHRDRSVAKDWIKLHSVQSAKEGVALDSIRLVEPDERRRDALNLADLNERKVEVEEVMK